MDILNSREWAILIWLVAAIIALIAMPSTRSSLGSLVAHFFHWKLQASIIGATLWCAGCVWVLWRLGLWTDGNLKTTIVWGLTFMIVTLFDVGTSKDGVKSLRSLARQAVTFTMVVGFIAEFYTLPLIAELLLVPFLVVTGAMIAMAELKPEFAQVHSLLNSLTALIGFGILGFSFYQIAIHWRDFATLGTVHEFAVPVLLSFMYLPFLYAYLLLMTYENASIRLRFAAPDDSLRRAAFWHGLLAFGPNVDLFGRYVIALNATDTFDRARIKVAIAEVRGVRRREKRPPVVDWNKGWSPYDAQYYLATEGLSTKDYHRSVADWWAEAPSIEVSGDFLKDRLSYRISGTEEAATQLTLELNAHRPGDMAIADRRFREVSELLVAQALGDEPAERYREAIIAADEGALEAGFLKVTWRYDEWGKPEYGGYSRSMRIFHPAHRDPFGLDGV
ncbi:MAG: hypothetical protein ABI668_12580 [Sphingorhabdus sp.]